MSPTSFSAVQEDGPEIFLAGRLTQPLLFIPIDREGEFVIILPNVHQEVFKVS